jgi:hypothetical protein
MKNRVRKQAICKNHLQVACFYALKGVIPLNECPLAAKRKRKLCFSKKLLIADYVILLLMVGMFFVPDMDRMNLAIVLCAWIAQIAISSGCYYWKAKAENLIKMPMQILEDLPDDMREKADPNQIIASALGIGTNNN